MTAPAKTIDELARRAHNWPEAAQQELVSLAAELEAELTRGPYRPTADELEGIDRGLRDAAEGRFAHEDDVEAVFRPRRIE